MVCVSGSMITCPTQTIPLPSKTTLCLDCLLFCSLNTPSSPTAHSFITGYFLHIDCFSLLYCFLIPYLAIVQESIHMGTLRSKILDTTDFKQGGSQKV